MNKNVLIKIIIILILMVVGWVIFGRPDSRQNSGQNQNQNVTLEASSAQESYNSGDEVSLNIKLKNLGSADACLSEGALGNIRFKSFARDGEAVEARSAPSQFLTSFSEILKSRLKPVAPGGEMEFNLASSFDPGLGTEALSTTKPEDISGITAFYNVEKPGAYEAELVYEYVAGPSDACKDILLGPTNAVKVTFTIK